MRQQIPVYFEELTYLYTLCPYKNVYLLFFEYFSQKSASFYSVLCTHMVDTFNSFCNCTRLKFQLSCGVTIGYLRYIQFLRETM